MTRVARPEALPPTSDRFVIVEASAGTGKTYFLENRVVDLILAGAELGQILLVTFTEKAVAELRLRIRDVLDRLARATIDTLASSYWEIDEVARARLRAAVSAFDHAPIFTIHGFCHRVLVEDAFAARRLFEQSQIADEVAFDTAFTALLRERFARCEPDRDLLAQFLEKPTRNTVDDLRKLLLQCARAGAPPRRGYDADDLRATLAPIYTEFADEPTRASLLASLKLNNQTLRFAANWFEQVGRAIERAPLDGPAPRLLGVIDALREPLGKLLKHLTKPSPSLAAIVSRCLAAPSTEEAITSELLPHILARIGADKAELGLFDYEDMLVLVRDALHGERGKDLAARLRARMPWVMIDEFQDTDPNQWQIFRTVWMHPDARGLTIVGDPKQAIYGFRGADVDTYLSARDDLSRAGATTVQLDINRRSIAQLVEAVNTILVGNFLAPLMTGAITYEHPVKACGDIVCEDHRKPVTIFALRGSGKEPNRTALASAIGDAIERLRRAPPEWRDRSGPRKFSLDHVMVLTRSNADSTELAAALRGRGLACVLVESDHLFQTREASELASVLAAIAAPRDRSARLRALRTRFFDVPWSDLMRVVDAPDHHPLIARLFDWAQLAGRRAYEPLFRRIVEESRFAERALVLGGGERALTNTWHVIELILEEVARSRSDLHELVVQLRAWIADRSDRFDERDVQRAETDLDAVRILTIHKAKGLEAPYVFLYGGMNGPHSSQIVHTVRDPVGRMLVVDSRDPAMTARLEEDRDHENQRLAYVALTRAQVRLFLPYYGDNVLKGPEMYHPIQRCLAPIVIRGHKLFETVTIEVGDDRIPQPPADALAHFVAPAPPQVEERVAISALRGGLAMLSYTRLAHDLEAAAITRGDAELAIEASEFDIDDSAAEVGPNDLPAGASSGLLLHDMLELADLDAVRRAPDLAAWAGDPMVRAQLATAARERGVGAGFLPHAAEVIHRTLTAPLEVAGRTLPPLVEAEVLAREVEFTFPLPGAPVRGLVRGYIDALVGWGDELWVVDYKSDAIGRERPAQAAQARADERYAVQARLYGLAANRLRGARRLAGVLFMFIREHVMVPVHIDDALLVEWTRWLGELREART